MNARETGERLVKIETVVNGTGDGSNGLATRFEKMQKKMDGLHGLMGALAAAGAIIGFMIGILVQVVLAKSH